MKNITISRKLGGGPCGKRRRIPAGDTFRDVIRGGTLPR